MRRLLRLMPILRTPLACITWPVTSGNGLPTVLQPTIHRGHKKTLPDRWMEKTMWHAAVHSFVITPIVRAIMCSQDNHWLLIPVALMLAFVWLPLMRSAL